VSNSGTGTSNHELRWMARAKENCLSHSIQGGNNTTVAKRLKVRALYGNHIRRDRLSLIHRCRVLRPNGPGKHRSCVVCNDEGKVLLAAWQTLRRCSSPEEVEAEACLMGLRLVAEWNLQPTCVEVDCLTLVRSIEEGKESRANWAGIISTEIRVRAILPGCKFQHVGREANKAAHGLAQRSALRTQESVVMRLNAPEEIRSLVEVEAARRNSIVTPCNPSISD
jgi:hypothetical protein